MKPAPPVISTFMARVRLPELRRARPRQPAQVLDCEHDGTGQREYDRDEEEEKACCEGRVVADVELAEEADEEGLPHREAVDRERDEHDEEEQRPHHVVRTRREVDADRLPRAPDREHANGLDSEGE